jgi:hypothetical protein
LPRLVSSWGLFAAAFDYASTGIDMAGMGSRFILHALNRLSVLFSVTPEWQAAGAGFQLCFSCDSIVFSRLNFSGRVHA